MSETLADALPAAIAKVSELIGKQEAQAAELDSTLAGAGDGCRLVARMLRVHRDVAVAAQQSGDVVAMLKAYNEIKPALDLANAEQEDTAA